MCIKVQSNEQDISGPGFEESLLSSEGDDFYYSDPYSNKYSPWLPTVRFSSIDLSCTDITKAYDRITEHIGLPEVGCDLQFGFVSGGGYRLVRKGEHNLSVELQVEGRSFLPQ